MATPSSTVRPERAGRRPSGAGDSLDSTIAMLKANARTGLGQTALRGRNIGILCEDPQRPEVFLLQRAATELGARVALVRPRLDDAEPLPAGRHTGRVLGRLYDALICVDMPARVVQELRDDAGIPAISDLTGEWIALRASRPDAQDDGRCLLQALLVDLCA